MALRNIRVGDDLSGATLTLQWGTLSSETKQFITGSGSYKYITKYRSFTSVSVRVYKGSAGSYSTITGQSTFTMPSDWGTVTSIDASCDAYACIFIDDAPKFTVNFMNEGVVIKTQQVAQGGNATPPANPTKASTAQYSYTFSGWDKAYTNIQSDTNVNATFTETLRSYTITWSIRGTTSTESYNYGATPSHANPSSYTADGITYNFTGWNPEISTVTGAKTYTALYAAQTATLQDVLETYGKQIDATITHGEDTYESRQVDACNFTYDGSILTSVMKQAEVELEGVGGQEFAEAMKGEQIGITLTATAGGVTKTKDYGTFIVKDAEYKDEYGSVVLTCYDLMLPSMKPYESFAEFPITLGNYLAGLCNEIGVPLATPTFPNSTVEIEEEKFDSQYTYRDAFTAVAQAAGGTIAIKGDQLHVLYPTESGVTIDPSNLKSITIGKPYTVNSVVLARTPQEDNIYKRDETAEVWNEIKIENNQLMDSHRDDFIDAIFDALNGLSFYPYEIESFGIGVLDICDRFTLEALDGTAYSTIFMAGEVEIGQGMTETARLALPDTAPTDYAAADTTDRRINQTILRVDKQDGKIEALVSETETRLDELTGELETVTQRVSQTITSEGVQILIEREIGAIDSITTSTGYTFGADGLRVRKSDSEIDNRIDHTGMYVDRGGDNVLTANADGVDAINLTAHQYLTIGTNSRFEDYGSDRTACFFVGG